MADKLPAMQFYTGDWLKDPALRAVPLAARGLWIDMISLMFESPRRGYLAHRNGSPISLEQLARMVGASTDEVTHLLLELETCGVFSRTDDGVIFSRRLVRDDQRRQANRLNGQKGGNPNLKSDNRTSNRTANHPDNRTGNQKPTPSSSSSSSSSSFKDLETSAPRTREGPGRMPKQGQGLWMDGEKLEDTKAVLSWLSRNSKRLNLDPEDFLTRNRVLGAAERAVDVGDDPGGVFVEIVRGGLWGHISDDQLARAKSRLAAYEASSVPAVMPAALLASRLGAER